MPIVGAGTSLCAGYPLTKDLTIYVLSQLTSSEKSLLTDILQKENIPFSISKGEPDIEIISDVLNKIKISGAIPGILDRENTIRKNILKCMHSVNHPSLDFHFQFFEKLKTLYFNTSESIWIFTTNYAITFEILRVQRKK